MNNSLIKTLGNSTPPEHIYMRNEMKEKKGYLIAFIPPPLLTRFIKYLVWKNNQIKHTNHKYLDIR